MLKGFKDFLLRGNVIDLAVAVVIGTAFTAVVNAVVKSVIEPLIALFLKADAAGKFGIPVTNIYGETVTFPIGDLISAIISFFAVAVVVYFVFVLPMNTFKAHVEARKGTPAEEPEEEPAAATEAELLVEIRDLLKTQQGPRGCGGTSRRSWSSLGPLRSPGADRRGASPSGTSGAGSLPSTGVRRARREPGTRTTR
ncbi:unnamed protein product [Penicillium discolor]